MDEPRGVASGIPGLLAALDIQRLAHHLPARGPMAPIRIGFLGGSAVQGYPAGKDVATQLANVLNARDPRGFEVGVDPVSWTPDPLGEGGS